VAVVIELQGGRNDEANVTGQESAVINTPEHEMHGILLHRLDARHYGRGQRINMSGDAHRQHATIRPKGQRL